MRIFALILALRLGVAASTELPGAQDVLGNLSKYDKLYVSYQNCAWSAYNEDCGVDGAGENDDALWYLGLTECYRANVAYTLYGVLKGAEDMGCSKATFINSFFSTSGIEYFTASMAASGVSFTENEDQNQVTSACNVVEAENEEEDGQNNNGYAVNNRKIFADDTSYGVGCNDKAFVLKEYQGRYCDQRNAPVVTDTLATFNNEIGQAQCVVIYDVSSDKSNEDGDENDNGEEENVQLLKYSEACNILNFPKECPDPFGKLRVQARATAHALAAQERPRRERAKAVISWILLSFGVVLLIAAAWAYYRKNVAVGDVQPQQTKKTGLFTGSLKSSSKMLNKTESSGSISVKQKRMGLWGLLRRGRGQH